MKWFTVAVLCLFAAGIASAQFTIVSTVPGSNATNVSASTTTVSITFSSAVDTTMWQLNQGKSQT